MKNILWVELVAKDKACGETRDEVTTVALKEGPRPSGSDSRRGVDTRIRNAAHAEVRQRERMEAYPSIRVHGNVGSGMKFLTTL